MKKIFVLTLFIFSLFCFPLVIYAHPTNQNKLNVRTMPAPNASSSVNVEELRITQLQFKGASGTIQYGEKFVNKNINADTHLILLLHGRNGMGNDNLRQLSNPAIPSLTSFAQKYNKKILILAPQCPQGQGWNKTNDGNIPINIAIELVKHKMKAYNISSNNVYVAGNSMGGMVCYDLMTRYSNIFSKAIIISSGGNPKQAQNAKGDFYILHSQNDNLIPIERAKSMVEALNNNSNATVKFKTIQNDGHIGSAAAAFGDDVWNWMFK